MSESAIRALFDERTYLELYPDVSEDAFSHFISIGWLENRNPHILFDTNYYLSQLTGPLPSSTNPLEHFISEGFLCGFSPHPLFDVDFYMKRHANELAGLDPLTHYLRFGSSLGFDPHPLFNTAHYLAQNPDMLPEDNALVHYLTAGMESHRSPCPWFDGPAYARRRQLPRGTNPLCDFVNRLKRARTAKRCETPDVSVIILNLNRSLMTLQAVVEVLESDYAGGLEVIVVDNGSAPHEFHHLAEHVPPAVKVLRLSMNRFFGEGNNLGVEQARGRMLLFLNNDAFVSPDTIAKLNAVFEENADCGAVGPKFLYPDGRIQEAGALVSSCGIVTQRGKHLENLPSRFGRTEVVDYVSAACVLIPATLFNDVGGFDLTWDPAYYEDVDLCLKLLLAGKKTYYCADAAVVHIENATSSDRSLNLGLNTIVEVNREKFIARWGAYLDSNRMSSMSPVELPKRLSDFGQTLDQVAVLYTPYPLVPGGGERYLLTFAQALSMRYRTILLTPEQYSTHRLRNIGRDLSLDLSRVELRSAKRLHEVGQCDLFIAMGNEALPPMRGIGRHNIFICQFPFPMHPNHVSDAWGSLDDYDLVVTYSSFAKHHFIERAGRLIDKLPPTTILAPPVPSYYATAPPARVVSRILNVGRFAAAGHCKRQDTLVKAFRELVRNAPSNHRLELHLAGTVAADPGARDYLSTVRREAAGLPVYFHLNAPPSTVRHLYQSSSLYWHGTGYGVWERYFPEQLEHFGISVIEAMSSGTLPLVCGNGGPAAIVTNGKTGFHWGTEAQLAQKSHELIYGDQDEVENLRRNARLEARKYDPAVFEQNLFSMLDEWQLQAADSSFTGTESVITSLLSGAV